MGGLYLKPVDAEIDDVNTIIFVVLEIRIGLNEFGHHIFSLLKQPQERPEKSPEKSQKAEHCTSIAEVMVRIPVEA